jgi:transcriptional antiterminator NusG
MAEEAKWYVVHTYSGYENKVKDTIEKYVENHDMYDLISEVLIPTEDVVEKKGDTEKIRKSKLFPGYVVIKMVMNSDSWYVVRNTRGVTGFVGPASEPVPLTEDDMARMGIGAVRASEVKFNVGDEVNVISGPMEGFTGKVTGIDADKHKVHVLVSMFNRNTPAELDLSQVKAVEF